MKKHVIILFFILPRSVNLFSCDLCGCYMGITPYDNQSSFGIYHRYRSFNGYAEANQKPKFFPKTPLENSNNGSPSQLPTLKHGDHSHLPTYSERDFEIYKVVELRAKYFIHQRIELNGILPFAMNSIRTNDSIVKLQSIGDINLFTGFHIIRPDETKKIQQRLIIGTGIKLATGHYYIGYYERNRSSILNQPGSGSNDWISYINYVFGFRKWGLSTNFSYKINGKNYFNEKIGNSITNFTNVFYKFKKNDFIFIPSVQTYFENTSGLFINDIYQNATSMNVFMVGPGFDLYYKNIGINSNFQFTASEVLHEGNLKSSCRFLIGLTYNFNQKKYLLNKRE